MAAEDYFPDLEPAEDLLDRFAQDMANESWQPVRKLKGGQVTQFNPDFRQINADDPETSMIDDDEAFEEQW